MTNTATDPQARRRRLGLYIAGVLGAAMLADATSEYWLPWFSSGDQKPVVDRKLPKGASGAGFTETSAAPAVAVDRRPAPLRADQTDIDFGKVVANRRLEAQVVLSNDTGLEAPPVPDVSVVGPIELAGGTCRRGEPIAVGANCTIRVALRVPDENGPVKGELVITGGEKPIRISLRAMAEGAAKKIDPEEVARKEAERARAAEAAMRAKAEQAAKARAYAAMARTAEPASISAAGAAPSSATAARLPAAIAGGTVLAKIGKPFDRRQVITPFSVISGVLERPLDTALPGPVFGIIDRPVFGAEGRIELIPAGSRIRGSYQASNSVPNGARRFGVVWSLLELPDGRRARFAWPGGDQMGRAGLVGDIDMQLAERFGFFGLQTAFNFLVAYAMGSQGQATQTTSIYGTVTQANNQAMLQAFQTMLTNGQTLSKEILAQYFPLRPSIKAASGSLFVITPSIDLYFDDRADEAVISPADPAAAATVVAQIEAASTIPDERKSPPGSGAAQVEYNGPPPPGGGPASATLVDGKVVATGQ